MDFPLSYDPVTGWLTWTRNAGSRARAGARAGSECVKNGREYREVRYQGKLYLEHQLIWFLQTGQWVDGIDHRDTKGRNNSWDNLRAADQSNNMMNTMRRGGNTSGFKGVYYHKQYGWFAKASYRGKRRVKGYFKTPEEAAPYYLILAQELAGEFARG